MARKITYSMKGETDPIEDSRIIQLTGEVNSQMADIVINKLLRYNAKNNDPIQLFINSPGGSVSAGLAIIDVMNSIKSDVETVVIGTAYSMGAVIAASGKPGRRFMTKNSRIMIHQMSQYQSGENRMTFNEMKDNYKECKKIYGSLITILEETTGQPRRKILRDCNRDFYMNVDEAIKYGIIDGEASDL